MRPLRFVALSEDGAHLVLAPDVPEAIDNGERFLLPVDDRLRAAARGDMSRLGQIELELESTLRPRDIQARIRAGETPEQVAAVAGIRVEKVLRYAHPVLQERERLAGQAKLARVRLADGTPAGQLGEFIVEKLSLLDVDHRLATWDARRLPDGSWEVLVSWTSGNRHGITRWWYDVAARTVTPADAETSAFAERSRPGQSMIIGPPVESPQRPLSALGPAGPGRPDPRARADSAGGTDPAAGEGPEDPGDRYDVPTADDRSAPSARDPQRPSAYDEGVGPAQPGLDLDGVPHPAAARPADEERETKARIPSWEDIVFGVRRKRG